MQRDPSALVVFVPGERVNQWKVVECPHCGGDHLHGAGAVGEDRSSYLGHRVSHCSAGRGLGYYLEVDASVQ